MAFFKPIWEKKQDVILNFIYRADIRISKDLRKLSEIVLYCSSPEIRTAAIKKLPDSDIKASIMLEAEKTERFEIVRAIIDSWNYSNCSVCRSPLFTAAKTSADLELLSLLAMKVDTLQEWENHVEIFDPLLDNPGHDSVVCHYNELKRIADEEKKAIARQKRIEAEKKRHDAFVLHPQDELARATGKRSEKKLWQEWYDYQLSNSPDNLLLVLKSELKDLNWTAFFPKGAIRNTVLRGEQYVNDNWHGSYDTERALDDMRFFLGTLYEQREDLREEILSLNGVLFYAGRKGGSRYALNLTVNVDDDYIISWDALPPYRLSLCLNGEALQICLDEVHND